MNQNKIERTRKKYIKPTIEKVKLVAGEASLSSCQFRGGPGRNGNACLSFPQGCSSPSS